MYRKLNYLASTLAPYYNDSGFMQGIIMELTMGWYLRSVPGFLTSLTYDVPSESPYEINLGSMDIGNTYVDDDSVGELPLIIKVAATFVPIHDFIPSLASSDTGDYTIEPNSRFISLRDGERVGSGNDLYGDVYQNKTYGAFVFSETPSQNDTDDTTLGNTIDLIDNQNPAFSNQVQSIVGNVLSSRNTNDPNFQAPYVL